MKAFVLLASVCGCLATALSLDLAQFCIEVQDPCCDSQISENSYQMGENDSLTTYWVFWDMRTDTNKATIIVLLDNGWEIFRKTDACDCGNTSFNYLTENAHEIKVKLQCEGGCIESGSECVPYRGVVRVYSPAGNTCAHDCSGS